MALLVTPNPEVGGEGHGPAGTQRSSRVHIGSPVSQPLMSCTAADTSPLTSAVASFCRQQEGSPASELNIAWSPGALRGYGESGLYNLVYVGSPGHGVSLEGS